MTVSGQEGTPQDISGAVTSVIVRYVRAHAGDYGLAQALAQAGELRPVDVLEDPRSWSTHDETIRLLAAASQVTGDADIGRHVGQEMLRQHEGTEVADLLRSLGSPAELLRNVATAASQFSTVSSIEPLEVGEAHAVVRALTRPGYVRHLYFCEFTKGLLAQVPTLFGLSPAVVTETECQARGGRFCLYSVAWEAGQWSTFIDDRSSLFSAAIGEQPVEPVPAGEAYAEALAEPYAEAEAGLSAEQADQPVELVPELSPEPAPELSPEPSLEPAFESTPGPAPGPAPGPLPGPAEGPPGEIPVAVPAMAAVAAADLSALAPEERVAALEEQLRQMGERLEEVFSTASDLLSVDDLTELLGRITRRAASAVNAPRYLIVVRTQGGSRAELHQRGFTDDEARALAEELWQPDPDDAGGTRLIMDVASSRQRYGRLAAVYPPGYQFVNRERELLSLYANYAATALDVVTALTEQRRSNEMARALLEFSRSLSHIGTTSEVAQTLADTVPSVVGCDRATVMLWDPYSQTLQFRALSGAEPPSEDVPALSGDHPVTFNTDEEIDLPEVKTGKIDARTLGVDDLPLLHQLRASRELVVVDRETVDVRHRAILEQYNIESAVLAPLFSDDEFLGIVSADFATPPLIDPRHDPELLERLAALADQAVTSFQNAWLLEQVGHQAWHDALTGLPNRRLLEDRVVQELERAKRVDETSTVFFVDLDRFKRVNDTLGHSVGDELLIEVSRRLTEAVRRQDTVARLGGDEFAILLPGLAEPTDIDEMAERMIQILHAPYLLEGAEVLMSASIGIAISPEDGGTYDELLSHADEAMYHAKEQGRNTFQFYDATAAAEAGADLELRADLERAVAAGDLFLEYQPYVKLATNRIVGVEALVRWRHAERGVIGPNTFLPEAEGSDLIVKIDRFVINEACRQLREWLDHGLPPIRVSVNVSGKDLLDGAFVETVIDALRENSIPAELCEIELTEHVNVDDEGRVRKTVERLHQLGVRFSIDDFGTGTLSMQQVAEFPVVSLKIDPSLVQATAPGPELGTLASTVLNMAEKLGVESVAKGVETEEQAQLLAARGCTAGQGAFFSLPLPPGEILRTVLDWPHVSRGNVLGGDLPHGDEHVAPPAPAAPAPPAPAAPAPPAPVASTAAGEDPLVDPFEISADVLSELGLDIPPARTDSPTDGPPPEQPAVAENGAGEAGAHDGDTEATPGAAGPKPARRTRSAPRSRPSF